MQNTLDYAIMMDSQDSLASYRDRFYIPQVNGKEAFYFTGNSLGLQPKSTIDFLQQDLDDLAL